MTTPTPASEYGRRKEAMTPLLPVVALCLVAVGVLGAMVSLRLGGYLLAALVALLGLGRLILPDEKMKGLVIRSRWFDAAWLFGTSLALAFLFATTPQLS